METPDALGWLAAGLMVATFGCRDVRAMRPLAVAANLAFIGYGVAAWLLPVLALHALLLPINLWRWAEARQSKGPSVWNECVRNVPRWTLVLLLGSLLVACGGGGGDPPPENEGPALELVELDRTYEFSHWRGPQSRPGPGTGQQKAEQPGDLLRFQDLGGLFYGVSGMGTRARMEIFSNATGNTYYAYAIAPADDGTAEPVSSTEARYEQRQAFRKLRDDATLVYKITQATLDVSDQNTDPPGEDDCPYEIVYKTERYFETRYTELGTPYRFEGQVTLPDYVQTHCTSAIKAQVDFTIAGRYELGYLGGTDGSLDLFGIQGQWDYTFDDDFSGLSEDSWKINTEGGPSGNPTFANATLKKDIRVPMDLKDVPIDGIIVVDARVRVRTTNHRYGESHAFATFKDPATGAAGPSVEYSGLEPVSVPAGLELPPLERPTPACSNAPGQAGGAIAFARSEVRALEHPGLGAAITLVRSGGADGAASVQVDTADGSAKAGADYEPVHRRVYFAPGQTRRTVHVPMTQDGVQEDAKSLTLRLADAQGCATLGALTESKLTIADDDHPLPPKTRYTVGGTVSGLLGSGLVLQDRERLLELAVDANGAFTFPVGYAPGEPYDIVVAAAPTAPAQVCEVQFATAAGNVSANVDNIRVECAAPTLPGSLDPGFGALGKVAQGLLGGARAIARQSTGHIVATNGARLVRYAPNGQLDIRFGAGLGYVDSLLPLTGGEVFDVAVDPDDRIVVAGRVLQPGRSTPYYQMAAARFTADGSRDLAFGGQGNGVATVRLASVGEEARRVLIQPHDARVLLVGQTTLEDGPANARFNNNIAVARLDAGGGLDASFGVSGVVVLDARLRDFGQAALLQPDGRVVVGGQTRVNDAENADSLFSRLTAEGAVELGFGRDPSYSALDDEIVDMALQADGKIVLLVAAKNSNYEVMLARIHADGNADTSFGVQGQVRSDLGPHDDLPRAVAVQADGRIVVAAQLSNPLPAPPSFGLLRYNPDGTPDASFGAAGLLRVPFFGSSDSANDLLVQPDGRIVAAGIARSGLTAEIAMVRVLP